ncbi:heavy-metal-associated domain-containing protein [Seinonella peptonophila]|uniref:heavy-metal-associated domain-containing protein n=1 Tax=Seinonella peptonophila TaxID=112248 RepID=UPI001FE66419|nr:heavy metal-associated domain-containing protein [Seinonella peptonophila]
MEKRLKVEDMTCGGCARKVKGTLDELGVHADVQLADRTVTIQFDEQKISLEQIKDSLEDIGYEATE